MSNKRRIKSQHVLLSDNFLFSTDGEVFASTDCVDMISRSVRVRHFGIVFGSPSSSCPSAPNPTCVDVNPGIRWISDQTCVNDGMLETT